ncbi:MAG TPA: TIGR00730 family Rossman fold protein [Schlesneria sp.]|jgi:hypothetical protein
MQTQAEIDHFGTTASVKELMLNLQRLCVFCGSSAGSDPIHAQMAGNMGASLAREGIELVYGGGSIGLMGAVADAVLKSDGHVIGVIPRFLATRELLHQGVSDMRITETMHERKALMSELSDAFVALPGGLGTYEELFEVLTWAQLGLHRKPTGLLNIAGFFDPLIALIDRAITDGFCRDEHRQLFVVDDQPEGLLQKLREHEMPTVKKWIPSTEQA